LIGDRPTLILIDEFARYLRVASGLKVGDQYLDKMTSSFLMALLGAVSGLKQAVVVYTLADSKDAFAQETATFLESLKESYKVSARQERIITPTDEQEIAPIVTQRMFKEIDKSAAKEIAQAYHGYYSDLFNHNVELPTNSLTAEYCDEITADYPFHPELLTTLNRKTATIPNFQKTRGALRLLALVIRRLWTTQPKDVYLIHPWALDLSVDDILNDLTSRLEKTPSLHVAEADIVTPGRRGLLFRPYRLSSIN
jgi:predicted AAA+ superfamily ATPase